MARTWETDYENDILFLRGRDISCSHVAFAATRVMGTLGVCGEVAGMAAAVCRKNACTPRDVYEKHFDELKEMMEKGAPGPGFYHPGGCAGENEFYHFKSDDKHERPQIYPKPSPLTPDQERKIRALGIEHRHEHPQLSSAPGHVRRLVLADESRGKLHCYDEADPSACFSIDMEKPLWNLTRTGDGLYRVVCRKGFMVADIKSRKVVDTFRHDSLDIVTSVCDMPDGGFLASVNPKGAKEPVILVRRFSKERKLVSTAAFRGIYYGRALTRLDDGRLLVAHEKGFAICRLPEGDAPEADGEIVKNVVMPKGRNLFEVVPARAGDGYWAGAGYGAQLLRFDLDGNLRTAWTADQGGKKNYFYAQIQERPDGHVYVANWTGHGANDSTRGWQVIEFDADGRVVWHLDDPVRFGSIHGLDVLE